MAVIYAPQDRPRNRQSWRRQPAGKRDSGQPALRANSGRGRDGAPGKPAETGLLVRVKSTRNQWGKSHDHKHHDKASVKNQGRSARNCQDQRGPRRQEIRPTCAPPRLGRKNRLQQGSTKTGLVATKKKIRTGMVARIESNRRPGQSPQE